MSDFALKKLFSSECIDAFQAVNQDVWGLPKDFQLQALKDKYGECKISDELMQSWRKSYNKAVQTGYPIIMSWDL